MRWILATGLAVAIATIAYAWLRGGDDAAVDVSPKIFRGDHSTGYWREHIAEYVRFYVAALARC